MDRLSPAQFARALALIDATETDRRRIHALGRQIDTATAAVEANRRAWNALTDFHIDQNRLHNVVGLFRRADADLREQIGICYRNLLRNMREPFIPGGRPMQVNFHALTPGARPYLAGPFLGIDVGGFPELCLTRSDPARGVLVYVHTGGPADPELWRQFLPRLSAWLGGTWTLGACDATTVTLIKREPLPQSIPYTMDLLKPGHLFVGIDIDTRKPLYIPFSELSAGTYIPGAAGSGKTSATHLLIKSLIANLDLFSAVWLVDGKDGVAFARYEGLHPKIRVLYDEPDVWALAADLTALMRTRNVEQRAAGIDKAEKDFVAVVVDELPTYIEKPATDPKKEHAAFLDNLGRLAKRGRSAGLRLFFITQTPVAEQIPVTLRANCATTIAFRLPETAHATALFGALEGIPDPRKLPTGQAIVRQAETGAIAHVQFPFAPLWNPRRHPKEPDVR